MYSLFNAEASKRPWTYPNKLVCASLIHLVRRLSTLEDVIAWNLVQCSLCLALDCGFTELHSMEGSPQISSVTCWHMTNEYTNTNSSITESNKVPCIQCSGADQVKDFENHKINRIWPRPPFQTEKKFTQIPKWPPFCSLVNMPSSSYCYSITLLLAKSELLHSLDIQKKRKKYNNFYQKSIGVC